MRRAPTQQLLLVEDNPGDARLLREMFNEAGAVPVRLTHVESMSDAEQHLVAHSVDIILLDLGLPDAQGLGAVRRARAAAPRIPLVVLTGLDDELLAGQALQEGAQDYLIKGEIETRSLQRAVRYAIERNVMEAALLVERERAQVTTLEMTHSAQHDFLTGLPNRMLLNERIRQAIQFAPRHKKFLAVLFLDLDGFKHINDSLGHAIGDKLLQSIARRLVECVRASDTVSRQGGDEFVVLLSEIDRPEDAAVSAKRMLEAVSEVHALGRHELHITTSIGVSVYPDDGPDAEALIKNADTAMYQAKESGRQSYRFFKPAMNVRAVERQTIEEDLRRAIDHEEFALYYQPKVNIESGGIIGAEALIRWRHPTRGLISPAQFIPVAEDSGLILPIGKWVLQEACRQAKAWVDANLPRTTIAVNVSAIEFRDEGFLRGVLEALGDTELEPSLLELEMTESVLIKYADSTARLLGALKARGVQVSVDDFGTGYSSLSYLRKFPVDSLKIDQSFVRQISTGGDDTAIVIAVINMARSLKLRVVAEGVETFEELAFLQAHACEEAQGYYFSRPVPAPHFARLLETGIAGSAIPVQAAPAAGGLYDWTSVV